VYRSTERLPSFSPPARRLRPGSGEAGDHFPPSQVFQEGVRVATADPRLEAVLLRPFWLGNRGSLDTPFPNPPPLTPYGSIELDISEPLIGGLVLYWQVSPVLGDFGVSSFPLPGEPASSVDLSRSPLADFSYNTNLFSSIRSRRRCS